ncbi:hypothetical protein C8Q79DRAFT_910499 [Trametes meyenii]|nr:hypothetical protein C8Q79DRAFT_910499 [Trametes meyenii]
MVQETDSKTVMDALTRYREKHENTGFILQKNGELTQVALAALRRRKAHTAFEWVKGHDGHLRNEGADTLAGEGARRAAPDELDLTIPPELRVSGAMLSWMTQKLAYRAIRSRKEARLQPRPSTEANLAKIVAALDDAFGVLLPDAAIWKSLRKKEVLREQRQFLWRTIHDAYMVGRHWLRDKMPDELKARAMCKVCPNELESMEHILFYCQAQERELLVDLLRDLWAHTDHQWPGANWGTMVGAASAVFKSGEDRLPATERLWAILATETLHLIWKLRCERVIQNDGAEFTAQEVKNRWYAAINQRLTLDRKTTAPILGRRALKPDAVESTWLPVIANSSDLPPNWIGDSGVLVGIKRGR